MWAFELGTLSEILKVVLKVQEWLMLLVSALALSVVKSYKLEIISINTFSFVRLQHN